MISKMLRIIIGSSEFGLLIASAISMAQFVLADFGASFFPVIDSFGTIGIIRLILATYVYGKCLKQSTPAKKQVVDSRKVEAIIENGVTKIGMKFEVVKVDLPKESNVILGMAHFIKTVEDIYEAMVNSVPAVKFGLAFCESSGECLVRVDGTDEELKKTAGETMLRIGCGHSFLVFMRGAYPINVLNAIKRVPEVCTVYAATANPLEVVIAETEQGRGILGVIDGLKPKGIEDEKGAEWRRNILRKFGYKK